MWKFTKKLLKTGIKSEKINPIVNDIDDLEIVGKILEKRIAQRFGKALAIRMVDAGSCNACELEVHATNNPFYNLESYGIRFVASPRHADMLFVTGPITKNMRDALVKTYEAMPHPKLVLAIGDCAHCGGVFKDSYAVEGGIQGIIPVDVVVKGCPPSPVQIIQGIFKAIEYCY
ncbi:NADH-quinone oxidoreductase subunit B family protein [Fastidiosibacter lacustris]|uniref:NADH-quinone oxidoreductase subunit B family protein n=1 Tax=Fastidiosibacter lacustris TaxID=2056695 RepID=UPI000E34CF68|nr:NADH-quinone oxidoreductase subunit NuoB [Fastidiosibacter lacustris]